METAMFMLTTSTPLAKAAQHHIAYGNGDAFAASLSENEMDPLEEMFKGKEQPEIPTLSLSQTDASAEPLEDRVLVGPDPSRTHETELETHDQAQHVALTTPEPEVFLIFESETPRISENVFLSLQKHETHLSSTPSIMPLPESEVPSNVEIEPQSILRLDADPHAKGKELPRAWLHSTPPVQGGHALKLMGPVQDMGSNQPDMTTSSKSSQSRGDKLAGEIELGSARLTQEREPLEIPEFRASRTQSTSSAVNVDGRVVNQEISDRVAPVSSPLFSSLPVNGLSLPSSLQATHSLIVASPSDIVNILSQTVSPGEDQKQRIMVQLDPPELGRVSIDFKFDAQGLQHVMITGETPEALRHLRMMHFELIQALEQHGLAGQEMSFRHSHQQQNAGAGVPGNPSEPDFPDDTIVTKPPQVQPKNTPPVPPLNNGLNIKI